MKQKSALIFKKLQDFVYSMILIMWKHTFKIGEIVSRKLNYGWLRFFIYISLHIPQFLQ